MQEMTSETVLRTCLLVVVIGASGCNDGAELSSDRHVVADTIFVENRLPAIRDTLVPREVARYGRTDGPADYLFGRIFAFAVDFEGSVYVHDEGEGIRVFGRDGEFQGRLAGRGAGPSEVEYLTALEASPDGRIAALDLENRRLAVFHRDGTTRTAPLPGGRPPYKDGAIVFAEDGALWIGVNPIFGADGVVRHPRPVFVRFDARGQFVDTIHTPADMAGGCEQTSPISEAGGFWQDRREPFLPLIKWGLGADGTFAIGCNATYRFDLHRPGGSVLRVSRRRPPVVTTQAERDFREAMPVPKAGDVLPAFVKLRPTRDGRTWVWPTQPNVRVPVEPEVARQYGVSHTWTLPWRGAFDVFSESGEWLAVVSLPPRARYSGFPTEPGVVIRGDTLWAVEQGELDVQTVVRYVVEGLESG